MANLSEEIRQVSLTHKERFRSPSEITAKYNLGLQKYHQLMSNPNTDRIHLQTLYSELKALGWVMGREEKTVIKEIMNPPKKDPNAKPIKLRQY